MIVGQWIAMRLDLSVDPAVLSIGYTLARTNNEVIGALYKVWVWANSQSTDGTFPCVPTRHVDKIAEIEGFAQAMIDVGWLADCREGKGTQVPNFKRFNGQSAKRRMLNSRRQKMSRDCHPNVALPARQKRDSSATKTLRLSRKNKNENKNKKQQQTPLPPVRSESTPPDTPGTPGLAAGVALRAEGIDPPTDAMLLAEFPGLTPELVRECLTGVNGGPGLRVTVLREKLPGLMAARSANAEASGRLGVVLARYRAAYEADPAIGELYGRLAVWEQTDRDRAVAERLAAEIGTAAGTAIAKAWVRGSRVPGRENHAAYRAMSVSTVRESPSKYTVSPAKPVQSGDRLT